MRYFIIISILLSVFLFSCSGPSTKEPKKAVKYDFLDNEEHQYSNEEEVKNIEIPSIDWVFYKNKSDKFKPYFQKGHTNIVNSVCFSPDGQYAISSSSDGLVKLWEIPQGNEIKTFYGHSLGSYFASFSPDGRYILSMSADATMRLWDISTGKEYKRFDIKSCGGYSAEFTKDGKYIVSTASENSMKLWDIESGKEIRRYVGHSNWIYSINLSPDNKYILSSSKDNSVKLWDFNTGEEIRSFYGHKSSVESATFSPTGKYVLSGSSDNTIKMWEVSNAKLVKSLKGHSYYVSSVKFTPNCKNIISGSWDSSVKLWDIASGKDIITFKGHLDKVTSISVSPNGRYILSGSYDNTLKLWDILTGMEVTTFKGRSLPINSVYYINNNKNALSVSNDKTIKLWDLSTGKEIGNISSFTEPILTSALSPDSNNIALGFKDGLIKIWDISSIANNSGNEIQTFEGHIAPINSLYFNNDGKYIISGSSDNTVKIWKVSTGRCIQTYTGHKGIVTAVTLSVNGQYAASGSNDGTIRIWDLYNGKEVKGFVDNMGTITSLMFSQDSNNLISGSTDGIVRIWEITSGKKICSLIGHSASINSVKYISEDKGILSCSSDGYIKTWDINTCKNVKTFGNGENAVLNSCLSNDEKYLLSANENGSLNYINTLTSKNIVTIVPLTYTNSDKVITSSACFTDDGYFNYTGLQALNDVYFVKGVESITLSQLFDVFYRPNLVSRVLSGEDFSKGEDFSIKNVKPVPEITIVSPKTNDTSTTGSINVKVTAREIGGGVKNLRLYVNNKLMKEIPSGLWRIANVNDKVEENFTVSLNSGYSYIKALATNIDGVESKASEIGILVQKTDEKPNLLILSFGINEYKNSKFNLSYGVIDAKVIADKIDDVAIKQFQNVYTNILENNQATSENIKSIFNSIIPKVNPNDIIIIYLSGNSAILDEKSYFYIPYDVTDLRDDIVNDLGLSQTDLINFAKDCKSSRIMLILDTCNSGGSLTEIGKYSKRVMDEERAISRISKISGMFVISGNNELSQAVDSNKYGHNPLTQTLLEFFSGKAGCTELDYECMQNYVNRRLPQIYHELFNKEIFPTIYNYTKNYSLMKSKY